MAPGRRATVPMVNEARGIVKERDESPILLSTPVRKYGDVLRSPRSASAGHCSPRRCSLRWPMADGPWIRTGTMRRGACGESRRRRTGTRRTKPRRREGRPGTARRDLLCASARDTPGAGLRGLRAPCVNPSRFPAPGVLGERKEDRSPHASDPSPCPSRCPGSPEPRGTRRRRGSDRGLAGPESRRIPAKPSRSRPWRPGVFPEFLNPPYPAMHP